MLHCRFQRDFFFSISWTLILVIDPLDREQSAQTNKKQKKVNRRKVQHEQLKREAYQQHITGTDGDNEKQTDAEHQTLRPGRARASPH